MDINFHIPDLLLHYRLNIVLYDTLQKHPEYFHEGVRIGSVYGAFPGAVWNGGRFTGNFKCDDKIMAQAIKEYNDRGIPVRYTFTNPLIEEKHLGNPLCNKMLRLANNGMNEVIVNSPILEKYIRENYPKFKITSSTCKELKTAEAVNAELEKDYNLVVLDYNWNNNFEFLESIERKDKCELLINACCIPNCPRRGEHYRTIGAQQIEYAEHMHDITPYKMNTDFPCEYQCQNLYKTIGYKTHISPDALYNKYVPMGYNQFKIEGRTNPDISVLENFVYYMIKPEYQNLARLEMAELLTDKVKYFN